jgi:hypothetical protein
LRYTLRTDGFASVNAPYRGGEWVTKPFTFDGRRLILNFSTGAAGSVRVELQDEHGNAVVGRTLADATELVGDEIERVASWKSGSDLGQWSGQTVKLRFVMTDADIYSLRFRP